MPLGLFKKVGNYRWTGGPGAELPRKPPIDTHGRYTCIQYNARGKERKKRKEKKRGKKKSEGLKKSEFRQKSEKRHPCNILENV